MFRPLQRLTPEGLPSEKILEGDFANLERTTAKQSRKDGDPLGLWEVGYTDPTDRFTDVLTDVSAIPEDLQLPAVLLSQTGSFLNSDESIREKAQQAGIIPKPDGNDVASLLGYRCSAPIQVEMRGTSLLDFFKDLRNSEGPEPSQLNFAMALMVRGTSLLLPNEGKSITPKTFLVPANHNLFSQWPVVSSVGYHKMLVNGSRMLTLDRSVSRSLQQEVDTNKRISEQTRENLERALEVQWDINEWKDSLLLALVDPTKSKAKTDLIDTMAGYIEDPNYRPFIYEFLGVNDMNSALKLFRCLERNARDGEVTTGTEAIKEQLRVELADTYGQLQKNNLEEFFSVTEDVNGHNEEISYKGVTKSLNNLRGIMSTLETDSIDMATPLGFRALSQVERITLSFRDNKSTVPVFDIRVVNNEGRPFELSVAVNIKDIEQSDWSLINNMFPEDDNKMSSTIINELLGVVGAFETDYEPSAIAVRQSRLQQRKRGRVALATTVPRDPEEPASLDSDVTIDTEENVAIEPALEQAADEDDEYPRIRDYMKSLPVGMTKTDRKEAMRQWFEEFLLPTVESIVDETWHLRHGADRLHLIGTGYTYIKTVYIKKASENGIISNNVAGGKIAHDDIVRLILLKDQPELFADIRWQRQTNKIITKALENIEQERLAEADGLL